MKRLTQNRSKKGFEAALAVFLSLFLFTGIAAASTTTFTQDSTVNLFSEDVEVEFDQSTELTDASIQGDRIESDELDLIVDAEDSGTLTITQDSLDSNLVSFDAEGFSDGQNVEFTIGKLQHNTGYEVIQDSEVVETLNSGDDGEITFSNDEWSTVSFELNEFDTVDFEDGTDLISIPSKVGSYELDEVIENSNAGDDIEAFWKFEDGEWQSYAAGDEHDSHQSEFENIQGGFGYAVKADDSGTLTGDFTEGDESDPGPSGITLSQETWNLVGHYETSDGDSLEDLGEEKLDDSEEDVSQVVESDGDGSFEDTSEFDSGEGYWVSVTESRSYNPDFGG